MKTLKGLPEKVIKAELKRYGITGKLAERYTNLLIARFVINNMEMLDEEQIREDLSYKNMDIHQKNLHQEFTELLESYKRK